MPRTSFVSTPRSTIRSERSSAYSSKVSELRVRDTPDPFFAELLPVLPEVFDELRQKLVVCRARSCLAHLRPMLVLLLALVLLVLLDVRVAARPRVSFRHFSASLRTRTARVMPSSTGTLLILGASNRSRTFSAVRRTSELAVSRVTQCGTYSLVA